MAKPGKKTVQEKGVNILLVGVGGQGVIVASEIICDAALRAGLDAKKSEVHGMSQRGGVVSSDVRVGLGITSPLISEGEADVVLAFEHAEAVRWLHYARTGGTVIVNTQKIVPPIAFTLGLKYPDESGLTRASQNGIKVVKVDAFDWAVRLGDARFANSILLGVLSGLPDAHIIPEKHWEAALTERFKGKMAKENLQAFLAGQKHKAA